MLISCQIQQHAKIQQQIYSKYKIAKIKTKFKYNKNLLCLEKELKGILSLKISHLNISNLNLEGSDLEIVKRLNEDNGKGIILLHGDPGTGKTSYIKYLTLWKMEKSRITY